MRRLAVMLAAGLLASCGVVGPPIAPETIGVAPTIERQKRQQAALEAQQREKAAAAEADEADPDLEGPDMELPPLQPVGTR